MVLSYDEHLAAESAINNLLPWSDSVFEQNWVVRLDFTQSTHLEAGSVDRELHTSLMANSHNTQTGKVANQYNHDVIHFAHDYMDLPA